MGIVTWWGATDAGDGVVNKVPEKRSDHKYDIRYDIMYTFTAKNVARVY